MKVYQSFEELVGKTPLFLLTKAGKLAGANANIFAKLEYFNPAGSIKDRAALYMFKEGLKSGKIDKNTVVIEPTSGNTGVAIAALAASYGIKAVIVMPETMSVERRKLMAAYGAEVVLTDGKLGMLGAINKAKELAAAYPKSFIPDQFSNHANPLAHYETTGREVFSDLDGKIDFFVAGAGTGGTISGAGKFLKENIPQVKIIGVEPLSSPVISGGAAGAHKIQGIGAGFIPANLDLTALDEVVTVSDSDAYYYSRLVAKEEGLFVGISSGAAFCAAVAISKRKENAGKNIVVIFPDGGDRYLSVENFV